MTHLHGYYGETSTEIPSVLAIWNFAARQASTQVSLKTALIDIPQRHRCEVTNAYKVVKKAADSGLLVCEDETLEDLAYQAGVTGQSLSAMLEQVGYWLHDTASTYWEQGRRDGQVGQAIAPEYSAFDRICAQVYVQVENLGFHDVSVKMDPFDRLSSVSAYDDIKKRIVVIASSVLLDDILPMVDKWAIELVVHREMNRSLRVFNRIDREAA